MELAQGKRVLGTSKYVLAPLLSIDRWHSTPPTSQHFGTEGNSQPKSYTGIVVDKI